MKIIGWISYLIIFLYISEKEFIRIILNGHGLDLYVLSTHSLYEFLNLFGWVRLLVQVLYTSFLYNAIMIEQIFNDAFIDLNYSKII